MLISSELEVSFNHLIKLMLCERYSIVYGLSILQGGGENEGRLCFG